jgi:hypothetical protein
MSLFNDILKGAGTVASAALSATGPVGMVVSTALNMFLDDDDKVTGATPITEAEAKFNKMSPEQQSQVANSYYDYLKNKDQYAFKTVDSNNNRDIEILRIKEVADSGDGAVRPWAVRLSVLCVVGISLAYCVSMMTVALQGMTAEIVLPSWEELSAALAIPSWIIRSYFTDRSTDKDNKLNAMTGNPLSERVSALAGTIKAFKR